MRIILKSLHIENFKGIKSLDVNFSNKTSVKGQNAAGKTTIFDAFTWLLFNKNSAGEEKFNVRPLDKSGNRIDNVEIKVVGVLDVDGKEVMLSKVQKQNWVKKRGTDTVTLQGNPNSYEIDGYPKSEADFKAYVSELAQSEDMFKLLTNPQYFSSLKWKEQRDILMKLTTEVSDVELAQTDSQYAPLLSELEKAPSTDDIRAKFSKEALLEKWKNHNHMVDKMIEIVKKYGLNSANKAERLERKMGVEGSREERTVRGNHYEAVYGDCVEETRTMESNSIDLIHTSIPFGNHYEYSANYNDFGHNQNTERFFEQMCYLTPELLRVLKPGRVAAIHVKDRVLFGNATGTGMPTIEPFHALCIEHYMKYGFQYFGMITVVTDVVRENNQTYRLGWTEQCKDGSKMGVGCPEYILLFRKLPTDRSTAYADVPVKKSKEDYTRAQWQIDAHGYWRSSGNRLVSKEELKEFPVESLQQVYRDYSRGTVYNYAEHVKLAEDLDENGKLPATFMVVAPGSWNQLEVWDDINRMRTLNTTQSRRRAQMHVCPLQLDIVERIINRYSNEGDTVYDPFGGLMTVPMTAVKMHRNGKGCELNPDYFRDGVGYLQAAENEVDEPTLFDFLKS